MKKFLAIFLVITLLFAFASCKKDDVDNDPSGQDTEQTGEESTSRKPPKETTTAPPFENPNLTEPSALFKIIDVNDYELQGNKPNTTPYTGVTLIAKRYGVKNVVANNIPAEITTGGAKIVLNETLVKDFIAQGWKIVSKNDANTAVEVGKDTSVLLQNSQGEVTKIIARNKANTSMAIADCVITEIGLSRDIEQYSWADFTVGGQTNTTSSTYADYVNAFGKPTNLTVVEYYKGNDYTNCKATLVFEKVVGNETWTLTVGYEDADGKASINYCIIEVN